MEAKKFSDFWNFRNWIRFLKKGLFFSIAYGLVIITVQAILGFFGIDFADGRLMASVTAGGIAVVITLIVGLIIQLSIGGFIIEYIENSSLALLRWIRR